MNTRRELGNDIAEFLISVLNMEEIKAAHTAKQIASIAIEKIRTFHSKALAAHCECLGMNAENMWAAIANEEPVYKNEHYREMMQKWGLMNEKGEPMI